MKRTQLYLDDDMARILATVSRQRGATISELVRECVREKRSLRRNLPVSPRSVRFFRSRPADGPSPLGTLEVRDLPGTTGAVQPFFSPDGQCVGFFTATGELKKVSVAGGAPVTVLT